MQLRGVCLSFLIGLGSARASRAVFGALAEQTTPVGGAPTGAAEAAALPTR